ncbi:MAG TPA: CoA-binding protein, partial [Candidatus Pacearchaeota archaeon]|nr:CoA-binding protein [Candidatus Pacearchaeota archaeon]
KKAASTHTGSLAGNYEIYKAMFKQSGVIAAHSLEEFLDIAKLCAYRGEISEEVAIITNGGGIGVLAVDYCEEQNIKLAKLKTETIDEINNFPEMHPAWSKTNPIDIIGDASPQRYKIALEAALKQENVQTILVVVTPQAMTKKEEIAQVIVQAQKKFSNKDIIGCFLGPEINKMAIEILDRDGVPNFPEIQRAIFAIKKTIK